MYSFLLFNVTLIICSRYAAPTFLNVWLKRAIVDVFICGSWALECAKVFCRKCGVNLLAGIWRLNGTAWRWQRYACNKKVATPYVDSGWKYERFNDRTVYMPDGTKRLATRSNRCIAASTYTGIWN